MRFTDADAAVAAAIAAVVVVTFPSRYSSEYHLTWLVTSFCCSGKRRNYILDSTEVWIAIWFYNGYGSIKKFRWIRMPTNCLNPINFHIISNQMPKMKFSGEVERKTEQWQYQNANCQSSLFFLFFNFNVSSPVSWCSKIQLYVCSPS